jgi:hypothetical protein
MYTDLYGLESALTDGEVKTLNSVRDFMREEITPIINDHSKTRSRCGSCRTRRSR